MLSFTSCGTPESEPPNAFEEINEDFDSCKPEEEGRERPEQ